MKFPLQRQLKIFALVSNSAGLVRYASTKALFKIYRSKRPTKEQQALVPELTTARIKNLKMMTSIVLAYSYVSWATIDVRSLSLLEWATYPVPHFQKEMIEPELLQLAHEVAGSIPDTELYLMEKLNPLWIKNFYPICFQSMLIALLSQKSKWRTDNIFFQNPKIVNDLHNLFIGGERMSARRIITQRGNFNLRYKNIHKSIPYDVNGNDCYSLLKISPKLLNFFLVGCDAEQEAASLALLIALSFIDINIFQNKEVLGNCCYWLESEI